MDSNSALSKNYGSKTFIGGTSIGQTSVGKKKIGGLARRLFIKNTSR